MSELNIELLGGSKISVKIKNIIDNKHETLISQRFYTSQIVNNLPSTTLFSGIDHFYVKEELVYMELETSANPTLIGRKI